MDYLQDYEAELLSTRNLVIMQLKRNNMSSLPLEHQMPQLNFKCCFDLIDKVTVIHCINVQSYRSIFNPLRKFRSSAGVHPSAKWNGRSKDRSTSSTCNSSFQFWDTPNMLMKKKKYIYTSHLLSQDVPLNVMNGLLAVKGTAWISDLIHSHSRLCTDSARCRFLFDGYRCTNHELPVSPIRRWSAILAPDQPAAFENYWRAR